MRLFVVAMLVIASAATAHAQYYTKAVVSGGRLKLDFVGSINPDCSSIGYPTLRVIQAPQHGRVQISRSTGFLFFSQANVRSHCNTRRLAGMLAEYQSTRGYLGPDSVTLEAISPTGGSSRRTYTIDVR